MLSMRRFVVAVVLPVVILTGLSTPVSAETKTMIEAQLLAGGRRLEMDEAAESKTETGVPSIMIQAGGISFDPLTQEPQGREPIQSIERYASGQTGYFIVQFDGPIQPEWKEALAQSGAEVFNYLPEFSFVVRMPADNQARVQEMPHVRWVGVYQPAYRISQRAVGQYYSEAGKEDPAVTVLRVDLFPGVDPAEVAADINALGGVVKDQYATESKTTLKIEIPADCIDRLPAIEGVKWIEPVTERKLYNDVSTDIMNVRLPRDDYGLYGSGQVIGVADTGLDQGSVDPAYLHDDFEDGMGASRVLDIIDRVAADETGEDGSDLHGHGTHVAGSVLGNGAMSGSDPTADDFSGVAGIAPKAQLLFQAVQDNDDVDSTTGYPVNLDGLPSNLYSLFEEARAAGAHLHTNSWGSATPSAYTTDSSDVDEYMWHHPEFLILFSAGNAGKDLDGDGVIDFYSIGSPGSAKNSLTVGASEGDRPSGGGYDMTWGDFYIDRYPANPIRDDHVSDDDRGMAAFSSRGPTLDGRYKPEIVAPGTNILSTRTQAIDEDDERLWGGYNDYYLWSGGTSMSTPLAAGAAALMREYLMSEMDGGVPSAALIKAALINSAEDISPGQYGTGEEQEIPDPPGPNNVTGWGRLNLGNGIFPVAPYDVFYIDETVGLQTGEVARYGIDIIDADSPLEIILTWTDYPGDASTLSALVNDLDLMVTGPLSSTFYPDNASQKSTLEILFYDHFYPASVRYNYFAVRFTPTRYPAYLDSAVFYYYQNSASTNGADVVVYGDDGTGLPDETNELFRKTLTYVPSGWNAIPVNLAISSGEVHIAIEQDADNTGSVILENRDNVDGRTSQKSTADDTDWYTSSFIAIIRGNFWYPPDRSTSFDRVNNTVGVTIDAPDPGLYTISVDGYNVPEGPQPYAMVVSGNGGLVGDVAFEADAFTVTEDAASVAVRVTRAWGSFGAASVEYSTADETALAGADYSAASGILRWGDGDSSDRTITVSIINDSENEPEETLNLTLKNQTGSLLGDTVHATLTIIDNDLASYIIDDDIGSDSGGSGSGGGGGGGCFIGNVL